MTGKQKLSGLFVLAADWLAFGFKLILRLASPPPLWETTSSFWPAAAVAQLFALPQLSVFTRSLTGHYRRENRVKSQRVSLGS
jgi:hypothetical protein